MKESSKVPMKDTCERSFPKKEYFKNTIDILVVRLAEGKEPRGGESDTITK